jgi:hypothetical protein
MEKAPPTHHQDIPQRGMYIERYSRTFLARTQLYAKVRSPSTSARYIKTVSERMYKSRLYLCGRDKAKKERQKIDHQRKGAFTDIHHTIMEDISGPADEVLARRLAPLTKTRDPFYCMRDTNSFANVVLKDKPGINSITLASSIRDCSLDVTDIHPDSSEQEVKQIFQSVETVQDFRFSAPGMAWVTYRWPRDRDIALERLNGRLARGKAMYLGLPY